VALVGFTSSIVTVRAFAAKNHYEIDVDRELVALGAAQLAAALSQSFPVAGTDSRTVASDAAGGRTQVTGLVAAGAIAVVLLFLTEPIRYVPMAALGAVLIKSAISLIDLRAFRDILRVDSRELLLALITVLGVLWFDAIQAVLIAVLLALARFIQIAARPDIELLGAQTNVRGFHDLRLYPDARTPPGIVLFRFNGALTFFNAGYFRERLLAAADAAGPELHAVIVDATGFSTRCRRHGRLHARRAAPRARVAWRGARAGGQASHDRAVAPQTPLRERGRRTPAVLDARRRDRRLPPRSLTTRSVICGRVVRRPS
jgi:MFS superfamily sulfate permease-like transporter